jgi:hypothetical protein
MHKNEFYGNLFHIFLSSISFAMNFLTLNEFTENFKWITNSRNEYTDEQCPDQIWPKAWHYWPKQRQKMARLAQHRQRGVHTRWPGVAAQRLASRCRSGRRSVFATGTTTVRRWHQAR